MIRYSANITIMIRAARKASKYIVRDFLELARACDSALTNLQKYEEGGDDTIDIYLKDTLNPDINKN